MKKPKFSILLPTKNRLNLLSSCINSVLEQNFVDFELIVSDNNSTDNTRIYCKNIFDNRLKYFRLNKDFPVTANWNNAYSKAKGEYIIIMGDDDYLTKNFLTKVNEQLDNSDNKIVIVNQARYYFEDYEDVNVKGKVVLRKYTNSTFQINSSKYLADFFNFKKTFHSASITIKKDILDTIINPGELGPYKEPFPDYTAIFSAISLVDYVTYVDLPLLIAGVSSVGCGIQAQSDRKRYWNDELSTKFGFSPPVAGDLFVNYYYVSQKIVQSKITSKVYNINIDKYLKSFISELFLVRFQNKYDLLEFEFKSIKQYSSVQPFKIRLKINYLLLQGYIKLELKKIGFYKIRFLLNKLNNPGIIKASSIEMASKVV
jgi:glycosyltransferase involved in cell wall biosynthesis